MTKRVLFPFSTENLDFYKVPFFIQIRVQHQVGSILETWIKTSIKGLLQAFLGAF